MRLLLKMEQEEKKQSKLITKKHLVPFLNNTTFFISYKKSKFI